MGGDARGAILRTPITAILWGTSFPVVSLGLKSGLDPRTFVFLRFAIASPLMLGVAIMLQRPVMPLFRSRAVWLVGFLNAVGFLCQFLGQQLTSASIAALLVNTSAILAALGGAFFLGEGLGKTRITGVVLAIAGTVLITTNGDLSLVTQGQLTGDALYLAAAVAWAGYIVYAKKKTEELHWEPVPLAASIVTITAAFLIPSALTTAEAPAIGGLSLATLAYTALFNTAIPFVLYQQGLRYLSAGASAIVLMLEIVVAVMLSVVFLGETLTAFTWIGAFVILASIVMVSWDEVRGKSLSIGGPSLDGVKASSEG